MNTTITSTYRVITLTLSLPLTVCIVSFIVFVFYNVGVTINDVTWWVQDLFTRDYWGGVWQHVTRCVMVRLRMTRLNHETPQLQKVIMVGSFIIGWSGIHRIKVLSNRTCVHFYEKVLGTVHEGMVTEYHRWTRTYWIKVEAGFQIEVPVLHVEARPDGGMWPWAYSRGLELGVGQ